MFIIKPVLCLTSACWSICCSQSRTKGGQRGSSFHLYVFCIGNDFVWILFSWSALKITQSPVAAACLPGGVSVTHRITAAPQRLTGLSLLHPQVTHLPSLTCSSLSPWPLLVPRVLCVSIPCPRAVPSWHLILFLLVPAKTWGEWWNQRFLCPQLSTAQEGERVQVDSCKPYGVCGNKIPIPAQLPPPESGVGYPC